MKQEIKKGVKALEKGIRNWYEFHNEQEKEFKRILDKALEKGLDGIELKETEGVYGLPGYKDMLRLNRAVVKVDEKGRKDYYIEADLVELYKTSVNTIGGRTLDFEELSDAIILSDVMHSMYAWEENEA